MNDVRLIYPGMIVVIGLLMLLKPLWFRDARRREHQKQLAARMARGSDAYFEELRALQAYPAPRTGRLDQAMGAALVLLGVLILSGAGGGR